MVIAVDSQQYCNTLSASSPTQQSILLVDDQENDIIKNLPVIMLTGSEHTHDFTKARELGATSFFLKSLNSANAIELSREVQRLTHI